MSCIQFIIGPRKGTTAMSSSIIFWVFFWTLLVGIFAKEPRRVLQSEIPVNPAEDANFMKCVDKGNCGAFNKCSFSLHGTAPSAGNGTDGGNGVRIKVTVNGHLIMIKNRMPYGILFFWNVIGGGGQGSESSKYKGKVAKPGTISYIDTGVYGIHRIRIAVSKIGDDPALLQTPPDSDDLEVIQTLLTDDTECAKVQACSTLDKVCYMAPMEDERCTLYSQVCNTFDNFDAIARDECIPECIYTYWTDKMQEFKELDSEKIVEWVANGGGSKDGTMDGFCNRNAVAGLSLAFFFLVMVLCFVIYLAYSYRRSYKESAASAQREHDW